MILTLTPNPCIDKTVWIDRLEAGRPVRGNRFECVAGGKGCNVSKAVRQLGGDTLCALVVGGHAGRHVVEMLEERHRVDTAPLWVKAPTRTITTLLETEQHRQTAVFEPGSSVTDDEMESIHRQFLGVVDGCCNSLLESSLTVVLCGTVPDEKLRSLYARLIPELKKRNVFVLMDSHGPAAEDGIKAVPDAVKPNRHEAEELLGMKIESPDDMHEAFHELHNLGIDLAIITDGAAGAFLSQRSADRFVELRAIPPQIEEVNPVGSGDCFVGGLVYALQRRKSIEDALRLACACGVSNAIHWDIGELDPEAIQQLTGQVHIETF